MAKSYFLHQSDAKSNTFKLVLGYIIGLLLVPVLLNVIIILLDDTKDFTTQDHLKLYAITVGVCAVPVLIGSLFYYYKYSGPGYKVAEAFGASPIEDFEENFNLKQLKNIVEELSFASGIKCPKIYILEDPTINAFAAGSTIDNSIICVNTGTLDQLNRSEISGVIAHEFSHIVNRDVNINIKIGTLIAGFSSLCILGWYIIKIVCSGSSSSSRNSNSKGNSGILGILIIGFTIMVLGFIWKFYSVIISAAISRQREYLADATAVSYTRDDSIARALIKIQKNTQKSTINASQKETCSHMFFSSEKKAGLFDSHPPLENRIKRAKEMSFSHYQDESEEENTEKKDESKQEQ